MKWILTKMGSLKLVSVLFMVHIDSRSSQQHITLLMVLITAAVLRPLILRNKDLPYLSVPVSVCSLNFPSVFNFLTLESLIFRNPPPSLWFASLRRLRLQRAVKGPHDEIVRLHYRINGPKKSMRNSRGLQLKSTAKKTQVNVLKCHWRSLA